MFADRGNVVGFSVGHENDIVTGKVDLIAHAESFGFKFISHFGKAFFKSGDVFSVAVKVKCLAIEVEYFYLFHNFLSSSRNLSSLEKTEEVIT